MGNPFKTAFASLTSLLTEERIPYDVIETKASRVVEFIDPADEDPNLIRGVTFDKGTLEVTAEFQRYTHEDHVDISGDETLLEIDFDPSLVEGLAVDQIKALEKSLIDLINAIDSELKDDDDEEDK